jgi:hypothetical protein
VHKIDDTSEVFLDTQGELKDKGIGVQFLLHLFDGSEEIRTDPVQLIHKSDFGDPVFIGLAPDRLRLGFNTSNGAENTHCPV